MFTEMMFVKYSNEKLSYVGVRRNAFSRISVDLPCYLGVGGLCLIVLFVCIVTTRNGRAGEMTGVLQS